MGCLAVSADGAYLALAGRGRGRLRVYSRKGLEPGWREEFVRPRFARGPSGDEKKSGHTESIAGLF